MSRRGTLTIEPDVKATLRSSRTEGCKLYLPSELERKHYERCNEALQRIGGKWSRKDQAHVFPENAQPLLTSILTMGVAPARNEHDFFATPAVVIERMLELLEMDQYRSAYDFPLMVLEPSAGDGAIVRAVAQAQPEAIIRAVEIDPKRAQILAASGLCDVTCGDFLTTEINARYDRVAMNPPFTSAADSLAYIEHIRRAYDCLEPGGILVSVAPVGVRFRSDKRVREFRQWTEERGEIEDLPDSAFAASGTAVSTVLITLRAATTPTKERKPVTTLIDTDPSPPPGDTPVHGPDNNPDPGRVDLILLSDIIPNSMQPRTEFDPVALDEMAESIKTHGVLQPILVRPWGDGTYELIAGERRWRASKLAGKDRIPAIVKEGVSDEKSALWALKENLDRSQLNAIDAARGFNNLIVRFGWTQSRVAGEVGLDQPTIAARLALLDMPEGVQALFARGELSPTHGKVLMGIGDPDVLIRLATSARDEHWSVARLRDEVHAYNREREAAIGQTSILDVPGVDEDVVSTTEISGTPILNPAGDTNDHDSNADEGGHDGAGEQAAPEEGADEGALPGGDGSAQEPEEDAASAEHDAQPALGDSVTAEAPIPPSSSAADGGSSSPASASAPTSTPPAPVSPQASTHATSSPSSAASAKPAAATSNDAEIKNLKDKIAVLRSENARLADINRSHAEQRAAVDKTIADQAEQIKKLQNPPPGFKRALVKEDVYQQACDLKIWPLQSGIAMLAELNEAVQSTLHPSAIEAGKLLEEWNRTAQVMTPDETEILHELYPERETTTFSMIASVLLVKRGRQFVKSADAEKAGISQ